MVKLSLLSLFEVMVPPVVSLVSLPPQQAYNAKLGFPIRVPDIIVHPYTTCGLSWLLAV